MTDVMCDSLYLMAVGRGAAVGVATGGVAAGGAESCFGFTLTEPATTNVVFQGFP